MTDAVVDQPHVEESLVVASSAAIAVRRDPREILAEAHNAAAALKEVLDSKKDPVMMNGERYIENDDWQTVGRFYGITAKIDAVSFVTYQIPGQDPIYGFDAVAVALAPDGRVISRAEASCLSDEEKWGARPKYAARYAKKARQEKRDDNKWHTVLGEDGKPVVEEWYPDGYEPARGELLVWVPNPNKPGKSMPFKVRTLVGKEAVPLFQLKSMAQTRSSSKVYRQVLAFVPVMAGYKPTPAEELEGYGAERVNVKTGEIVEPNKPSQKTTTADPRDPDDPLPGEVERGNTEADEKAELGPDQFYVREVKQLKSGDKDGNPWTLFGVVTASGQVFQTFDHTIADAADKAHREHRIVEIHTEPAKKGNGRKIVSLTQLFTVGEEKVL